MKTFVDPDSYFDTCSGGAEPAAKNKEHLLSFHVAIVLVRFVQTYLTPLWDLDTVTPRNVPRIHTPSYLAYLPGFFIDWYYAIGQQPHRSFNLGT